MGKQKRQRKKLHSEAKNSMSESNTDHVAPMDVAQFPPIHLSENVFEGLNIDVGSLNKNLSSDAQSVKSLKAVKSDVGRDKILPKKEKLMLRREMFLKKLNAASQLKKQNKSRNQRKNSAIIGDINPLRDALPSLESLLKTRTNVQYKQSSTTKKPKSIEKTSKRKKNHLQGIDIYKQIFKNKTFQKNPLTVISEHLKTIVTHTNVDQLPSKS